MASTYTNSLKLLLQGTGDNAGNWGALVNTDLTTLVDTAVAGYLSITMINADYTLTSGNGSAANESRNMYINVSGTISAARNVICPAVSKLYFIRNSTVGGFGITLKTPTGSGVVVPNGRSAVLMCDGTNVIEAVNYVGTDLSTTNIAYTGTLTGGTGVVNLGSGQFYKDASGNIALGANSAAQRLQLYTATNNGNVAVAFGSNDIIGTPERERARILMEASLNNAGSLVLYTKPDASSVAERLRIDSIGNLGVGTTPQTWQSNYRAIQVGQAGAIIAGNGVYGGYVSLAANQFVGAGPVLRYINNASATGYTQLDGDHIWDTAPNGIAGATTTISSGQVYTVFALGSTTLAQWQAFFSALTVLPTVNQTITATATGTLLGGGTVWQTVTPVTAMKLGASGALFMSGGGIPISGKIIIPKYDITGGDYLSFANRGTNVSHLAIYDVGGIYACGYRDVADPAYIAGITFSRGPTNGGASSSGAIVFRVSNVGEFTKAGVAEAMRLDSSGNLLVGTATAGFSNDYSVKVDGTQKNVVCCHPNGATDGTAYAYFTYNSVSIGSITQDGTTAVRYNTNSDQRLKTNIVDAPDAAALIDSIKVRSFDWISDQSHQRYGMVAQELAQVAPEAVHSPANPDEMMAVDYSKLVPMLVKEIQSLRARVAALEA